jgi:hypothetical protein
LHRCADGADGVDGVDGGCLLVNEWGSEDLRAQASRPRLHALAGNERAMTGASATT